jgi:hypothetical protein
MIQRDRDRFAINASSNNREFLLGGLLAKARGYNQKNKKKKKKKMKIKNK